MSDQQSIISVTSVTKTFVDGERQVNVLKNIDLKIDEAEMVAMVGMSGAGKSTLLHIMGGLDKPTSGKVIVVGRDITLLDAKQQGVLRNRFLGFIYQFHHLLPEFDALENVCMPLLVRGDKPKLAKGLAKEMLAQVGLSERFTHRVGELSGGGASTGGHCQGFNYRACLCIGRRTYWQLRS